jgi:nitrous oxide reductase accessory protein NosL
MNGPILEQYQEKEEKINTVRYSTMLEEKVNPAICSHHHGLQSKGVLLLHNNKRPHTLSSVTTVLRIQKLPEDVKRVLQRIVTI